MKICFIPIDNRPVCYNLAKDIVAIDSSIELLIPPRKFLGDLKKTADIELLFDWLKECQDYDAIVLSLDTIAYGGLIPSRRSLDSFDAIKSRIERLKQILEEKDCKIYAFSSIMRISNNNYNEEEKEYWSIYGKKIFEYSYSGGIVNNGIPEEILIDYKNTRKRNFEINKIYLEWYKAGFFDTLIFSKDDCAESGFNIEEAKVLEQQGGKIKTGADEIPLTLLARALEKRVNVFVQYIEPKFKDRISNYEDISIENSIKGQLELAGLSMVSSLEESDLVLIVNNFIEKQGELVMGWDTKPFTGNLILPQKPYAVADVRFANGADNNFVESFFDKLQIENFFGYSAWNTSANTLGSLLASIKFKFGAKIYNELAFNKLQTIRFLDDWAYQANIRAQIEKPCDIKPMMKFYESKIAQKFNIQDFSTINYKFPWDRKFEVEIVI